MSIFKRLIVVLMLIMSVLISTACVVVLKERTDKMDVLRVEYKRLTDIRNNCIDTKNCNVPKDNSSNEINNTWNQILKLSEIENHGEPASICGGIPSITSGSNGFENDCYLYESLDRNHTKNPEYLKQALTQEQINQTHLIIYQNIKSKFIWKWFTYIPSETLYLMLIMACSLIGASCIPASEEKHLIISPIHGFVVYTFVTGAKDVEIFGHQQFVTNINPFSMALMGILSGMYVNKFLKEQATQQPTKVKAINTN